MRRAVSHVRADLVLFVRDEKTAHFTYQAIRSAMREVQAFYRRVPDEDTIPRPQSVTWDTVDLASTYAPATADTQAPTINLHYLIPGSPDASESDLAGMWDTIKPGTLADQAQIAQAVREWMPSDGDLLVVITDELITPPPEWRYVIWDLTPSGFVMTIAPLDPEYWGDTSADAAARLTAIKRRTRAALLSILGTALGLRRCDNPECYLFRNVESVVRLDEMRFIGPEHDAKHLIGWGFDTVTVDAVDTPTWAGGAGKS